jgi:hypothetical protein
MPPRGRRPSRQGWAGPHGTRLDPVVTRCPAVPRSPIASTRRTRDEMAVTGRTGAHHTAGHRTGCGHQPAGQPRPDKRARWPDTGRLDTGRLDQRRVGQAAPQAGRRPSGGPWRWSTLMRARHGQRCAIPSCQAPCGQATTPPRTTGHVDRLRPRGAARHTESLHFRVQRRADSAATAPRTLEACPSGHLDTPDAWTPTRGRWTSARPVWTDVPTAGPRTRTRQRPAWPASGHPRDRRPHAGRPDLARVTAPGSARPPRTAPR